MFLFNSVHQELLAQCYDNNAVVITTHTCSLSLTSLVLRSCVPISMGGETSSSGAHGYTTLRSKACQGQAKPHIVYPNYLVFLIIALYSKGSLLMHQNEKLLAYFYYIFICQSTSNDCIVCSNRANAIKHFSQDV